MARVQILILRQERCSKHAYIGVTSVEFQQLDERMAPGLHSSWVRIGRATAARVWLGGSDANGEP